MRYFFPCTPSPPSCEKGHPPDSLGTGLIAYGAYFWYNIDDRLVGVSEVSGTPEQFTIGFQAPENLHFIAGGTSHLLHFAHAAAVAAAAAAAAAADTISECPLMSRLFRVMYCTTTFELQLVFWRADGWTSLMKYGQP